MSLANQITVLCRLTIDRAFRDALTQSPGETLARYGYAMSPKEVLVVEQTARLFERYPEMGDNLDSSVRRPCRANFSATFAHAEAELAPRGVDLAEAFVQSQQFWRPGQTWLATRSGTLNWQEKAQLRERYNYLLDCFYLYMKVCIEKGALTGAYLPDLLQYEYDCYNLPLRLYPLAYEKEKGWSPLPSDPLRLYPRVTGAALVRTYNYPATTMTADLEGVASAHAWQPQRTFVLFGYGGDSFVKLNLTPTAKEIWSRCDGCTSVAELADSFPQKQAVLQFLHRLFEYRLIQVGVEPSARPTAQGREVHEWL